MANAETQTALRGVSVLKVVNAASNANPEEAATDCTKCNAEDAEVAAAEVSSQEGATAAIFFTECECGTTSAAKKDS